MVQSSNRKSHRKAIIVTAAVFIFVGVVAASCVGVLHSIGSPSVDSEQLEKYGEPIGKDGIYKKTDIRLPDGAKLVSARLFQISRGTNYIQVTADVSSVDTNQLLRSFPKNMEIYRYDQHIPSQKDKPAYDSYESARDMVSLWSDYFFRPNLGVKPPKPGRKFIYAELQTKADANSGEIMYIHFLIQQEKDGRRYLYLTGDFD